MYGEDGYDEEPAPRRTYESREPRFSSDYERIEYDTYMKLCPQGNTSSCANLGDGFANGKWGVRDPLRAAKYYEMACSERSVRDVCLRLAKLYESGDVPASDEKVYQLFARSCNDFEKDGCESMRKLAGKTGRLAYRDARLGVPALTWYCGATGICYQDPRACRKDNDGSECITSEDASCFLGQKPGAIFWACAQTSEQCSQLIKPLVSRTGGKAISTCSRMNTTPPGMVPGNDWYCVKRAFGSNNGDCERDLASCQQHERGSYARCEPQRRAACVVYFDQLNDKYQGACFATLDACNSAKRSLSYKDDFKEVSECFPLD